VKVAASTIENVVRQYSHYRRRFLVDQDTKGEHRMTMVEQKLRQIVTETFLIGGENGDLPGDTSFIDTGIIDSTGILQLAEFIEQEFNLKIEDEDLIPENLDSINRLVAFVEKKKRLSSAEAGQLAARSSNGGYPVGAASPGSD
jgi:acyl carrier protein